MRARVEVAKSRPCRDNRPRAWWLLAASRWLALVLKRCLRQVPAVAATNGGVPRTPGRELGQCRAGRCVVRGPLALDKDFSL